MEKYTLFPLKYFDQNGEMSVPHLTALRCSLASSLAWTWTATFQL